MAVSDKESLIPMCFEMGVLGKTPYRVQAIFSKAKLLSSDTIYRLSSDCK
jgi:hypothetical protein